MHFMQGDYELDLSLFGWGSVLQAEYEAKQLGEMSDKKALISHMFEEMIGEVRPQPQPVNHYEHSQTATHVRARAYTSQYIGLQSMPRPFFRIMPRVAAAGRS